MKILELLILTISRVPMILARLMIAPCLYWKILTPRKTGLIIQNRWRLAVDHREEIYAKSLFWGITMTLRTRSVNSLRLRICILSKFLMQRVQAVVLVRYQCTLRDVKFRVLAVNVKSVIRDPCSVAVLSATVTSKKCKSSSDNAEGNNRWSRKISHHNPKTSQTIRHSSRLKSGSKKKLLCHLRQLLWASRIRK